MATKMAIETQEGKIEVHTRKQITRVKQYDTDGWLIGYGIEASADLWINLIRDGKIVACATAIIPAATVAAMQNGNAAFTFPGGYLGTEKVNPETAQTASEIIALAATVALAE